MESEHSRDIKDTVAHYYRNRRKIMWQSRISCLILIVLFLVPERLHLPPSTSWILVGLFFAAMFAWDISRYMRRSNTRP